MVLFEIVIALLLAGAMLSLWSSRLRLPYPALLALAGAVLALVPGIPEVQLDPELALALFVAPTLLDAAFDASPRDLRHNMTAVVSLALGAVAVTIVSVAVAARWVVPELGWAAAITLGAIVAPPDAAAATTVLRQINPPHRLMVILEGESLFNDASALLVYRIASAAALTGLFSGWGVVWMLLLTCGGGMVAGVLLGKLYVRLTIDLEDIPISVMLQFIGTFGVWILAERLGLSAIIAVVCYAMTIARLVPGRTDARHRIASYAVWEVTVFVLNALAFVLIGLQLRAILTRLGPGELERYGLCAAAVCAALLLARLVWVMSHNTLARWHDRCAPEGATRGTTVGTGLVIAWCGMRGIVSLATALALPLDPTPFPQRDLIVFCAFAAVIATLVLQGLTLRWLIERVGLRDDGIVEREIGEARARTARAALAVLTAGASAPVLQREYEARLRSGEALSQGVRGERVEREAGIQRELVAAQRRTLVELRASNVIGDAAFHAVEEELDLLELTADPRVRPLVTDRRLGTDIDR